MTLVFATQKVDVDDPILGATVAKIHALAQRFEHVHVLALSVARHDLPPNVTFATFGAPNRPLRVVRYLRVVTHALRRRPDAFLSHMIPVYLVLAAPLAKLYRVPLLLWYTHWTLDRTLRVATWLADAALSVDRRSYPLESRKVVALGHGIDVGEFAARTALPQNGRLALLALGRTSPSKGYATLLEAMELALERGLDADLVVHGPSTTEEERRHRRELSARIEHGPLNGRVRLEGPVPRPQVPELLRRFDAVVNPTRGQTQGGALDKVVFESAATAVPVLACNPHFSSFLGDLPVELRFGSGDAGDLAEKLLAFAASSPEARLETGRELRRRVERGHATETWAEGVGRVVRNVRERA